jgi:penicillin-binding protein 1A
MPSTVIEDAPFTAINGWSPENSDGQYDGALTLRDALARSRNLVSVRVLQQVGVAGARQWAVQFGLDAARQPDNLTLALGTGSVTPLQLAQAYAVIANGGYRVAPVLIERITDAKGVVLFEAAPAAAPGEDQRVIPARNAFLTATLLNEVTKSGTAARAQVVLQRPDLYGKTGTTSEAFDAWFAGFQPSLVAVVWMGYDEPRSLGERESGGGLALPIWLDYMAVALRGVPVEVPVVPAGLAPSDAGWLYEEWAAGGAVAHIGADGRVERWPVVEAVPPPAPLAEVPSAPEPAASAAPR